MGRRSRKNGGGDDACRRESGWFWDGGVPYVLDAKHAIMSE